MARKVINVVYKVDDRELIKTKSSIQSVEKETKDAEKEMMKLDKAVVKTGRDGFTELSKLSGVIGAISFAAITAGVVALGKKIIDLGIKQEQLNIAFTTFLGSAERAKKVIADLTKFSIVTPFTPDQVNSAAKALLAFGVQGEELIPTLKMLGDVSAGTGKDLTEMAVIFGQIRSTGRLMGQDLLQLINAGFNPLQEIAAKTGKTGADLSDEVKRLKGEMEKGNISFQAVADSFKRATSEGGLFFNLMEKQSQSLGGKFSTIQGNIEEIGKAIYNENNGSLTAFINILVKITSNVDGMAKMFNRLTDSIASNPVIAPLILALAALADYLEKNKESAHGASTTWEENTETLKDNTEQTSKLTKETEELLKARKKLIDEMLKDQSEGDLPGFGIPEDFFEQYRDKVDKGVNDIYNTWKAGNDAIEQENIQSWESELEARSQALKDRIKLEEQAAERSKQLAIQLGQELLSNMLLENTIATDAIRSRYDTELELAGDNERAKKEIQKRQTDELKKIEEENKAIQKRNAIKSILIDTAAAVIKTFLNNGGYPTGVLPAALMGAIGVAAAANVRKYKDGEIAIDGAGTSTSDSIPAMLSKGESVINAKATSQSRNLLEAINERKIDDSILGRLASNGGRQTNFDDSGIIRAIEKNKVDYITQGYSLYQATQVGKNFKRTIRSKVQGY